MSKIGRQPILIPEGVTVKISGREVEITGPKGSLVHTLPRRISVVADNENVVVSSEIKSKQDRSLYGTTRALIANMVKGVKDGWVKELELVGTGYRAEVAGADLVLTVGYSHPVKIAAPEGIKFSVEKTLITVEGRDRRLVGQIAANIRMVRPPAPPKGKGIKYRNEVVRRKAGKAAKTVGAPA